MSSESGSRLDRAEIERRVSEIWRDVLGARPGQDDATFFELSGQSIAAVRITARIEDEVGVLVDIGELFEDPDLPAFVAIVLAKAQTEGQLKLPA
ncbi:phosphopantetheine-binding protein [Nonomuraea sp. NPDC005983]|uniref:phosphopantetheine-binding protein n=1 Tax=Nonomuraea sp. NPDC005983 TaxID=3155595 RepID=UPI0033BEB364